MVSNMSLPISINRVKLKEVAVINMGQSPAGDTYNNVGAGTPLLNGPTEFGLSHPTTSVWTTAPTKTCRKGDLLFCVRGSTTGRMNWADREYCIGRGICAIRAMSGMDDTFFVYYTIVSELGRLLSLCAGSVFPNISVDDLESFEISWPDKDDRTNVVAILKTLDDRILLNSQININLEEIGKMLFKRWFVDFEFPNEEGKPYKSSGGEMVHSEELEKEIPEGWKTKPIDEIADFLNGLAMQKFPAREGEDYLPVVKIRELRQGITQSSDKANLDVPEEYFVNDGDVLFSWSGSLELVIWGFGKGALNQHLFKVTSSKYPKWFFYHWVLHYLPEYRQIAADKATTMGHIQRHHLAASQVTVPDDETLERMDKLLAPILKRIIRTKTEAKILSEIRSLLLPKFMSGKIRVPVTKEKVEAS